MMVEVMFRFFSPRRKPSFMREMYCGYVSFRILYFERGDREIKKKKLQCVCCRLYPFILLDNKKEGHGNFSGGHSPHLVKHVYMCLYFILYILCFISSFVFILLLQNHVFLTLLNLIDFSLVCPNL
jgi:hypothetical protein